MNNEEQLNSIKSNLATAQINLSQLFHDIERTEERIAIIQAAKAVMFDGGDKGVKLSVALKDEKIAAELFADFRNKVVEKLVLQLEALQYKASQIIETLNLKEREALL